MVWHLVKRRGKCTFTYLAYLTGLYVHFLHILNTCHKFYYTESRSEFMYQKIFRITL
jgi:hypothetical protein